MEALRDVALGAVTWFFALAAMGGIMTAGIVYLGPPAADRARSFAFIAGGGVTLILLTVATAVFVGIYMSQRS